MVAVAEGRLGACRDYLFNTLQHLETLGIRDHGLERVASRVRHLRARAAHETGEPRPALGSGHPASGTEGQKACSANSGSTLPPQRSR